VRVQELASVVLMELLQIKKVLVFVKNVHMEHILIQVQVDVFFVHPVFIQMKVPCIVNPVKKEQYLIKKNQGVIIVPQELIHLQNQKSVLNVLPEHIHQKDGLHVKFVERGLNQMKTILIAIIAPLEHILLLNLPNVINAQEEHFLILDIHPVLHVLKDITVVKKVLNVVKDVQKILILTEVQLIALYAQKKVSIAQVLLRIKMIFLRDIIKMGEI
jgi:hypothetical protein